MQSLDASTPAIVVGESFRQAKIEHYLQRAEEYFKMARYQAAEKTIKTVFALDPHNRVAVSLERRLEFVWRALINRTNGTPLQFGGIDEPRQKRTRGKLVMVVDQDELLSLAMTESLRRYGFGSISAGSYSEALETLAKVKPDLIISEVNFENGPVGYDLFMWCRNNASMHSTPFLFFATKIDRDTLIAGKRLGVDDFILKPFDEGVITASVISCLSHQAKERNSD